MAPHPVILPLSQRRRRLYFQLLLFVFIVSIPLLFLYATGYRFDGFTGLVRTGGLYVGAERADAEIYVNGELVRETGTFRRAFFIQDLEPGEYTVRVEKDGYHPWGKTLPVFAHIVTEAQAFNLPRTPLVTLIPQAIEATSATTTQSIPNPFYEEVDALFATTTATSTAALARVAQVRERTDVRTSAVRESVATTTKVFRDMVLFETDGRVAARWVGRPESIPFYFCVPHRECAEEIVLNTRGEEVAYFDFFPGSTDLAVVTLPDGVYVTELDNRSGQNIQPLFIAEGADFRILNGVVYVAVGARRYQLEL